MMKHLVYNMLCCSIILLFVSCEKKVEVVEYGSLYGTVVDKNTGNAIRNAWVELQPVGLKAITGTDGQFEFTKVEERIYRLYVTKGGYSDYMTGDIVVEGNEENKPVFIQLEQQPPALTILDDNQHKIDTIDFGATEGDLMRSFTIFNDGDEALEWEIVYIQDWIVSFSKEEGVLPANGTQAIVVKIDRTKLQNGTNTTVVHIVSNNGSKQITVIASAVNAIETTAVTDITPTTAVLNGRINKQPNAPIVEYGFVYGEMPTPSLDNGATKVLVKGTVQIGAFSAAISGLTEGTTYFVRAYATTEEDEYYGTTNSFRAEDVQCVTLVAANLMVQKVDLGRVDQHSAVTMCESSTVGGYYDWRLPTIEELMTLYTNRENIGGFSESDHYWSSTTVGSGNYKYIDFATGAVGYTDKNYAKRVRAVRTLNPVSL